MTGACRFFVVLLGLVCLVGCRTAGEKTVSSKTLITSENVSRIASIQWTLKEMALDGNEHHFTGERPFVKFGNEGEVAGFASVNRFSGSMQLDGREKIRWSPFRSTRMAGPRELMNQESAFLQALPRTCRLSLDGTCLYAQSDDGQVELVFYMPVE